MRLYYIGLIYQNNIQARYPAYKDAVYNLINKEKAKEILKKTGALISWLKGLTI